MSSNTSHTVVVLSQSSKRTHRATTSGMRRPPKRCFDVHDFTYGVVCGLFFISIFSVCLSVSFDVFNSNQPVPSTGSCSGVLVDEQSSGQLQENKEACVGREVAMLVLPRSSSSSVYRIRLSLNGACVLSGVIKNVKFSGISGNRVPWQAEVNPMGRLEVAFTVEQQRER